MPVVDSDLIREIIKALKSNTVVQNNIAKDVNNEYSIRPGDFVPTGAVLPQICVTVEEGSSEPSFLASHDTLTISIWVDPKRKQNPYAFLTVIMDAIVGLFNREGSDFNNIDVPTNTGVRICQLLKATRSMDYDPELKYFYGEVVFEVVRSEGESFAAADAGDKPWT